MKGCLGSKDRYKIFIRSKQPNIICCARLGSPYITPRLLQVLGLRERKRESVGVLRFRVFLTFIHVYILYVF